MQSDENEEVFKNFGPKFTWPHNVDPPEGQSKLDSVFTKACTQLNEGDPSIHVPETHLRKIVASEIRDSGLNDTLDFLDSPLYMKKVKRREVAKAPERFTWDDYVGSLLKDHPGDMLCIAFIAKVLERSVILTGPGVGNKSMAVKPIICNNAAISISPDWPEAQGDLNSVQVPPAWYIPNKTISLGDVDSFRSELRLQYEINKMWNELYAQTKQREIGNKNSMRTKAEENIDPIVFGECMGIIQDLQTEHVQRQITLKEHQIEGVKFALSHVSGSGIHGDQFISRGCLLAHSMGAGKTIQTFFVMRYLLLMPGTSKINFVIVCPLAMLGEWYNNIKLFHKDASEKKTINKNGFIFESNSTKGTTIALLTPKALISQYNKNNNDLGEMIPRDDSMSRCLLIFDEAHDLKNPRSQISQVIMKIHKESNKTNFLLLTGTPLQNNLSDLFNICKNLILAEGGQNKDKVIMARIQEKAGELLRKVNDSNAYRNDAFLKKMYQKVINTVQQSLAFWVHRVSPANVERHLNVKKRQFDVFFKLKKKTILHDTMDTKFAKERYSNTALESWNDINTSKPDFLRALIQGMDGMTNQKAIFMFYHTKVGQTAEEIIQSIAQYGKDAVTFVNGATEAEVRKKTFERFNDTNNKLRYLVIQEQVGGVGVNLQYGGNVIVFLQGVNFNPSITQQAIARIYRMGQLKDCYILNLLTYTSLEMAKLEINTVKKLLSKAILDTEVATDDTEVATEDTEVATDDTEKMEDGSKTLQGDPSSLGDFRKIYQDDFDKNQLAERIDDEWQHLQPGTALPIPSADTLDSIPAILAEIQTRSFGKNVKMEEDIEHSTPLPTGKKTTSGIVKEKPALERFVAVVKSKDEENTTSKKILKLSNPESVVNLLKSIQNVLLTRVYYCESTGLYVSKDALDVKPPLFWPGTPLPHMDVCVPNYAHSQNLAAFLSETEMLQIQGADCPKIKLLTEASEALPVNDKHQKLIDNVQFCLHYPSQFKSRQIDPEIDMKMVVENLPAYFEFMLNTVKGDVRIFAIPKLFVENFKITKKKRKKVPDKKMSPEKYIYLPNKKIGTVNYNRVMEASYISTTYNTTETQKPERVMELMNSDKKTLKTVRSTDPVLEVKMPDEPTATLGETVNKLYKKDFLTVFACTTEQDDPVPKTLLFVKDNLLWWSFANGALHPVDLPPGRLKSVFVYIPRPEIVQVKAKNRIAWGYNDESKLLQMEYDSQQRYYQVCAGKTSKTLQDLKTKMIPNVTYFRYTTDNKTLKKFLLDYFTFILKNQLGLELLRDSDIQFDVANSNDETETRVTNKKQKKTDKLTVLYENSIINLKAEYTCTASQSSGETERNGSFNFELMDSVFTVTNKVQAAAGLTNLTLKKIDGVPIQARTNSTFVAYLNPVVRLNNTTSIFTFEQQTTPAPKKQAIVYWRKVETRYGSIEFKEESDDLKKEDVTCITLKINKDKNFQNRKLCFLSPVSKETIKKWIEWEYQRRLNIDARCMLAVVEESLQRGIYECKTIKIKVAVTGMSSHQYENSDVSLFDTFKNLKLGDRWKIQSVNGKRLPEETTITDKNKILEILEGSRPQNTEEYAVLGVENITKQRKAANPNSSQQHPYLPVQGLIMPDVAPQNMQNGSWIVDAEESPKTAQITRPLPGAQASRPNTGGTNGAQASRPNTGGTNGAQTTKTSVIDLMESSDDDSVKIIDSDDSVQVIDSDDSPETSPRATHKDKQPAQGSKQNAPETSPGATDTDTPKNDRGRVSSSDAVKQQIRSDRLKR